MAKKKLPDLQIVELLLVKAGKDWTRTYMAQIRRELDNDGNQIICGEVLVEGWKIWSIATTEEELGRNLDGMCEQVLAYDINDQPVKSMLVCGPEFFNN